MFFDLNRQKDPRINLRNCPTLEYFKKKVLAVGAVLGAVFSIFGCALYLFGYFFGGSDSEGDEEDQELFSGSDKKKRFNGNRGRKKGPGFWKS